MVISAKVINAVTDRVCDQCGEPLPAGEQLRCYGAAHHGDPPYTIYIHTSCSWAGEPKISAALQETPNSE